MTRKLWVLTMVLLVGLISLLLGLSTSESSADVTNSCAIVFVLCLIGLPFIVNSILEIPFIWYMLSGFSFGMLASQNNDGWAIFLWCYCACMAWLFIREAYLAFKKLTQDLTGPEIKLNL